MSRQFLSKLLIRGNLRTLRGVVVLTLLPAFASAAQEPAPSVAEPLGGQRIAPIVDSLAGQRISWELIEIPAGNVVVPEADGVTMRQVYVEPFLIWATEVPWELYDVFYLRLDVPRSERSGVNASSRPSSPYGAPDRGFGHRGWPTISITHGGATRFATWLSERTGHNYAVPTDAQWQRVADLVTASLVAGPGDNQTRHRNNSDGKTNSIQSSSPDQLGLYDLFGNAGEWTTGVDGTPWLRGGSFMTPPESLTAQFREKQTPAWNQTDPQDPKSRWWLSDAPFAGLRLVRMP